MGQAASCSRRRHSRGTAPARPIRPATDGRTGPTGLGGHWRSPVPYRSREEVHLPVPIGSAIALLFVVFAAGGTPQASSAGQNEGRLSGITQISYGCPGPQREGEPCEHWSSFAQARFLVTRLGGGEARTVTSGRRGRFTLVFTVGRYRLTPLRQAHTTGGTPLTVTIQAATTTWTRVRFQGLPRML